MQLMTIISSIDDLNYPEKTLTYYIVNAPYVFSACWKVCPSFLALGVDYVLFLLCKAAEVTACIYLWNPRKVSAS